MTETEQELESEIARLRVDLAEYVRCEQFGVREVIAQAERAGISWSKAQEIVASIIVREAHAKADLMVYNERRLWAAIARAAEILSGMIPRLQDPEFDVVSGALCVIMKDARAKGLTWEEEP